MKTIKTDELARLEAEEAATKARREMFAKMGRENALCAIDQNDIDGYRANVTDTVTEMGGNADDARIAEDAFEAEITKG